MFTTNEKNAFISYIQNYGKDGQSLEVTGSFDEITRVWRENKSSYLLPLFGNKTMLRKHISLEKDEKLLVRSFFDFAYSTYAYNIYVKMSDFIFSRHFNNRYEIVGATETRVKQILAPISYDNFDLKEDVIETLLNNRAAFEFEIIDRSTNSTVVKIQKGMKYTKLLRKAMDMVMADEFFISFNYGSVPNSFSDAASYEKFCTEYSKVKNDATITGDLVLSIHPLDYITMSDNEYNWSSCMSWRNNGCYHGGTIEMMNSASVIVAYLDGKVPMILPDGTEWSNKRWRELFIVTSNGAVGVKPYPYYCEVIEAEVLNWLKELMGNYQNGTVVYSENKRYHFDCGQFYTDVLMYNDFECRDDDGNPYFEVDNRITNISDFCYSGPATCIGCGEYLSSENIFSGRNCYEAVTYCKECSGMLRACPICGEIEILNRYVDSMEEYVCEDCFSERDYYNEFRNRYEIKDEENKPIILDILSSNKIRITDFWGWKSTQTARYGVYSVINEKDFTDIILPRIQEFMEMNNYKIEMKNNLHLPQLCIIIPTDPSYEFAYDKFYNKAIELSSKIREISDEVCF